MVPAVAAEVTRTEQSNDSLRVLHLHKEFGHNHAVNDITEAAGALLQGGNAKSKPAKSKKNKKRKRDSSIDSGGELMRKGTIGGTTVYIASEEFIVQCLIHGEIIQE